MTKAIRHHHILISVIILSVFLAVFLFQQQTYSKLELRDLSDIQYAVEPDMVQVYADVPDQDVSYITLNFQFDQETVHIDTDAIQTEQEVQLIKLDTGYLQIVLKTTRYVPSQPLIRIPYIGTNPFIVLGEAQITDTQGQQRYVSIANL